jgi:hypothetical protein
MYSELGVYSLGIEQPFLEASHQYYSTKAANLIGSLDLPEYLKFADTKLKEESDRTSRFFLPSTLPLIIKVVEDELLTKYVDRILSTGNMRCLSQTASGVTAE